MRLKAVFVCDDVRQELGNKLTIVGMYNDVIMVGGGEGGIGLPKLAAVFVLGGLRGVSELAYRSYFVLEGAPVPDPPLQTIQRNADTDEHNFLFAMIPAIFPGPGAMRAILDAQVGGQRERFEYRFEIRRASMPSMN